MNLNKEQSAKSRQTMVRLLQGINFEVGVPFGSNILTAHIGFISAEYKRGLVHVLQIDGSVKRSNSGGPLAHVDSGKTIGIITRSQTGLEQEFDQLINTLDSNVVELSKPRGGRVIICGFDPTSMRLEPSWLLSDQLHAISVGRPTLGLGTLIALNTFSMDRGFSKRTKKF